MSRKLRKFVKDTAGSSMVELSLILPMFFLAAGGSIDFGYAFWQWNAAAKAVEAGARTAATSNPVSSDLANPASLATMQAGVTPGAAFPYFIRVCNGATAACSGGTYDAAAMANIVGSMSPFLAAIKTANVTVTYEQTGLGFACRPGGPVPTITVKLQNITFNFLFLNLIPGVAAITMPAMTTTMTGEDMSSSNASPAASC